MHVSTRVSAAPDDKYMWSENAVHTHADFLMSARSPAPNVSYVNKNNCIFSE